MATAVLAFSTPAGLSHEWQSYQQITKSLKDLRAQAASAKAQLGQRLADEQARIVGTESTPEGVSRFKAWLKEQGIAATVALSLIRSLQPKPARVTPAISLRGQTLTMRLSNPRHAFFLHHILNQLVESGETKFILAEVLINNTIYRLKNRAKLLLDQLWHDVKHTFSARDCRKLPPIAIPYGVLSEKL